MRHLSNKTLIEVMVAFLLGFLTACGASPSNTSPQPASSAVTITPADSRPLNEQANIDRTKAVDCKLTGGEPSVGFKGIGDVSNPLPESPKLIKCCDIYIILGGDIPLELNDDDTTAPLVNTLWQDKESCWMAISNTPIN